MIQLQNSHIPEFCVFVPATAFLCINLNEACLTSNADGLKVAFGILETWVDCFCVSWKPMHLFLHACCTVAKHGMATIYNVAVLTHFWPLCNMKSIPVAHGSTSPVLVVLIANNWLHSVWSIHCFNFALSKQFTPNDHYNAVASHEINASVAKHAMWITKLL